METSYRVREGRMVVVIISDGQHNAPRGVLGGRDGCLAETHVIADGDVEEKIPNFHLGVLDSSSVIRGRTNSGGGYGDPRTRDPKRVLEDVLEGWESVERARDVVRGVRDRRFEPNPDHRYPHDDFARICQTAVFGGEASPEDEP